MIRLAPGVYDDERGALHLVVPELLLAHGYADTEANRQMLISTMREVWKGLGNDPADIVEHEEPLDVH